jgi:hypothetical protein
LYNVYAGYQYEEMLKMLTTSPPPSYLPLPHVTKKGAKSRRIKSDRGSMANFRSQSRGYSSPKKAENILATSNKQQMEREADVFMNKFAVFHPTKKCAVFSSSP